MKRGKGLRPGKALARGRGLKRTGRLQVHPRRSRTDPAAVAALEARSGGRCEMRNAGGYRCMGRATEPHHRRTRQRAGKRDDSLDNLAHLCASCHQWVHGHPHWATDRGWLLPSDH